jgi:hypothetical protein
VPDADDRAGDLAVGTLPDQPGDPVEDLVGVQRGLRVSR